MTFLITGFEPFGGATRNISQDLVEALDAAPEAKLATAVLPTAYARAQTQIEALLEDRRPSTVVLLGLARTATTLRFEEQARNLCESPVPDNDGEARPGQPAIADAPEVYSSSLPLTRMAQLAEESGETASRSQDAGGYVCNHVFYTAAHFLARHQPSARCGFVHLPPVPHGEPRFARLVGILRHWIREI